MPKTVMPEQKFKTAQEKLDAGWRYVKVPYQDPYEYPFKGIALNHDHYAPGTHLVPGDVADTLEERLEVWRQSMIRLMSPARHKKSLAQVPDGPGAQVDPRAELT